MWVVDLWEANIIEILTTMEDDQIADMVVDLYFVLDARCESSEQRE